LAANEPAAPSPPAAGAAALPAAFAPTALVPPPPGAGLPPMAAGISAAPAELAATPAPLTAGVRPLPEEPALTTVLSPPLGTGCIVCDGFATTEAASLQPTTARAPKPSAMSKPNRIPRWAGACGIVPHAA
jgi:hypothetical protein